MLNNTIIRFTFIRCRFISSFLNRIQAYIAGFFHLFYPHICMHCGSEELDSATVLCQACEKNLPYTEFLSIEHNKIEKIFWGRVSIQEAGASLFFTKESIVQVLIFALKYKHQKKAGRLLGNIMGQDIINSQRFKNIDCMIPIPLSKNKERKRGYNQAMLLCQGIQEKLPHIPILPVLLKQKSSKSQTRQNRIERNHLRAQPFRLVDPTALANKNILIVDDVITTGATMEAAASYLGKEAQPRSISLVAAAYTI